MPYDITDAKEDIEKLYRELINLEKILVDKKILPNPKEEEKKTKISEEDL